MARDKSRLTYPLQPKHVRPKNNHLFDDCLVSVCLWIVMDAWAELEPKPRMHEYRRYET